MLPDGTPPVPASLMTLLAAFSPLFTAPSFRTFTMLACGFLAQPGKRTVCGMLAGAGLSRLWPHDRAHSFFSRARWSPDDRYLSFLSSRQEGKGSQIWLMDRRGGEAKRLTEIKGGIDDYAGGIVARGTGDLRHSCSGSRSGGLHW